MICVLYKTDTTPFQKTRALIMQDKYFPRPYLFPSIFLYNKLWILSSFPFLHLYLRFSIYLCFARFISPTQNQQFQSFNQPTPSIYLERCTFIPTMRGFPSKMSKCSKRVLLDGIYASVPTCMLNKQRQRAAKYGVVEEEGYEVDKWIGGCVRSDADSKIRQWIYK